MIPLCRWRMLLITGRRCGSSFGKTATDSPKLFETPESCALRTRSTALLRRAADPRVTIIETSNAFENSDNSIRYYSDLGAFYRDNNHLNRLGTMELVPVLKTVFAEPSLNSQPKLSSLN